MCKVNRIANIVFIAGCVALLSCSRRAPYESQNTVRIADSLWTAGLVYEDSASLAQAYAELGSQSNRYPTEYAHACYHYGRLLRAKDNPVEAMRCFINATHTNTTDYHFLGRVYSNMGTICHLAGEFPLSCDMYKRSADFFLQNEDTLNYYFALNDMVFELILQQETDSAKQLLQIIRTYPNTSSYLKSLEMEAFLCQALGKYDSVICLTNQLQESGYKDIMGYMMKARAYGHLNQIDSALWYAQKVVTVQKSSVYHIPAYYILTHFDHSLSVDSILSLTSSRADIQKEWGLQQGTLSQAAQLAKLDLEQKPEKRKIYPFIVIIISSVALFILIIIGRIRKQRMQKKLTSISQKHKDDIITSIQKHIDTSDLNSTLHWKDYTSMKSDADLYMRGIVSKLEAYNLNETEIRFCILTVLDFSLKQIANTIFYSYPSGIKTLKKRISDKLGTTPPELKNHLLGEL